MAKEGFLQGVGLKLVSILDVKWHGSEFKRRSEEIYLRISQGVYPGDNGRTLHADDNSIIRFVFLKEQLGCSVVDRVKS